MSSAVAGEKQTEKQPMGETQQYGKRWNDLPAHERKDGYWLAAPDRKRICWGDMDYEVVYVCRDVGLVWVWPIGRDDCEPTRHWRFLWRLDLPQRAADLTAEASAVQSRQPFGVVTEGQTRHDQKI